MNNPEFPQEEFALRWSRAREAMRSAKVDALLITDKYNYWYFTGHRSRQFDHKMRPFIMILPVESDPILIIYGRDEREVRSTSGVKDIRSYVDVPFPLEMIQEAVESLGLGTARIGAELGPNQRLGLPYLDFSRLKDDLLKNAEFVDASNIFSELRVIKTPREIEAIKQACDITLRAWQHTLKNISVGMNSREVAEALTVSMIQEGGELDSTGHVTLALEGRGYFHTYALGETMWCDFGAVYKGYRCDIARRAVFGPPTKEQLRDHETIWKVLKACIDAIRPGVRCSDIARVCNDGLRYYGYEPMKPSKRAGHGLGLADAEPPSLSSVDDTVLQPGMVLTPEPRFFIASGERLHIEEDIVVTPEGCLMLTTGAEELSVIS